MKDKEKQYKKEIEAMKYFANKNAVSILDIVNTCGVEKQIEEMADILCESKEHNCNGEDCKCIKQATDLFNKGAKILPEDIVVLSRGAYESISSKAKANVVNAVEIRKETAEKIFVKIKQFLSNVETVVDKDIYSLYPEIGYKCSEVDDFLDKLEKQLSVEIKE